MATDAKFADYVLEAPPYPGAKLHFLVSAELDDSTLLARLIQATVAEVPKPKPKKPKLKKPKRKKD